MSIVWPFALSLGFMAVIELAYISGALLRIARALEKSKDKAA